MSDLPNGAVLVRHAGPYDTGAILTICSDVIVTATAVCSQEPASLEERRQWFLDKPGSSIPVLVACRADEVLGFATFGTFRPSACYGHGVEHSLRHSAEGREQGSADASARRSSIAPRP